MFTKIFQTVLLAAFCFFLLASCSAKTEKVKGASGTSDNGLIMRADPGYLHYLERQSLLANSATLSKSVSGTSLAWGTKNFPKSNDLLVMADTWIFINPMTFLTSLKNPTFTILESPTLLDALNVAGIKGIYIAPTNKAGALWVQNREKALITGEDIVQFAFSDSAGTEKQYHSLMRSLMAKNMLMGGDVIPAATGLGPDFFLATRNHRDYPGVYYLAELPKSVWAEVQNPPSEWEGRLLSEEETQLLESKNILPAGGSFWGVTGEIRGIDAQNRRWIYRTNGQPPFATMNFEDPSKNAQFIMAASAIQQVGVLGQSLVGLQMQSLQSEKQNNSGLEPALGASHEIGRDVAKYGGWSWLRDNNMSLFAVKSFLETNLTFVLDNAFSPAAEHALLTGDASLANFMADELVRLDIDTSRFVHASLNQDGLNYTLPHLKALTALGANEQAGNLQVETMVSVQTLAEKETLNPFSHNTLYTTSAGLAAMALKLEQGKEVPIEIQPKVAKGIEILLFFKAMKPGIFMPSGQDMVGLLPLHYSAMVAEAEDFQVQNTSRGAYALTAMAKHMPVTHLGMPRGNFVHPTLDVQMNLENSLLKNMGEWQKARQYSGIAHGKLIGRANTENKGSIALVFSLPEQGKYMLTVYNFGQKGISENINLNNIKALPAQKNKYRIIAGDANVAPSAQNISVQLSSWGACAIMFEDK